MVIEAGGNHARERKIEMRKAAGLPTAFAIGVLSLLPGGRCAWSQPHLPLQYQGGPILKSFKIYPLYYGDWSAADINFQQAFLTNLTAYISGAYAPAGEQPMLMQYGVNTATVAAAATADPTAAPKTLSRSDVINIIHTNQAAGKLPAYGPNTVIFVFPAHGFDVSTGTPPTPCHGCGYHSSESPSELWAVVPADSGPTLQLVTAHEVFESATDSTVDSPPRGWVSLDGSEAVDGCNDPIPAYPFINLSLGPVAIQIPGAADNTQDGICSTTGYTLTPPVGVRTAPAGASPGEGSGFSQTMTFTFTDPRGWQDLDVVNVLINNFLDGRSACYVAYSRSAGVLYLVPDAGGGLLPALTLGGSGSTGNSQCTVSGTGSYVAGSGDTLTLTASLSFSAAFAGDKVVYLAARDLEGGNSGWQALGTWSIPGASLTGPAVGGVTPARSSGSGGGTLTFTFTDTKGWQDLGIVNVLINDFLNGNQACYLAYSRAYNTLYLVNDAGTALLPGLTLNGAGSVNNSQCTVTGAGSLASGSGNTLTLTLNLSFLPAFAGNRVIYAAARSNGDALNSGWQAVGSRTVQ